MPCSPLTDPPRSTVARKISFRGQLHLLLHALLSQVDHDIDMDIAVAGMAEVDDRHPVAVRYGLQGPDHLRHPGAGHDNVLVELVRD